MLSLIVVKEGYITVWSDHRGVIFRCQAALLDRQVKAQIKGYLPGTGAEEGGGRLIRHHSHCVLRIGSRAKERRAKLRKNKQQSGRRKNTCQKRGAFRIRTLKGWSQELTDT